MVNCYKIDCQNKDKCCHKCFSHAFYKEPKVKKRLGDNARQKTKKKDESWKDLEAQVARDISSIPKYYDAVRQIQSGAQWFATGDVADAIVHIEAKERQGNEIVSRGEKSFTIEKKWLDKAVQEAEVSSKPSFLPFRFKGDTNIHVVTQWKYIADLIRMVKSFMIENDKKEVIIKELHRQLDEIRNEQSTTN